MLIERSFDPVLMLTNLACKFPVKGEGPCCGIILHWSAICRDCTAVVCSSVSDVATERVLIWACDNIQIFMCNLERLLLQNVLLVSEGGKRQCDERWRHAWS